MIPQTETPDGNQSSTSQATPAVVSVPPKPGFKSSEFAATVASAIALGSGYIPANYQPLFVAVVGLYVACRTLLKVVHALGYAKSIPDLPEVVSPITGVSK